MKNIFSLASLIVMLMLGMSIARAQTVPQGITYQGLARSSASVIIVNQPVSVRTGIYSNSPTGTLQWEETHTVTTSMMGTFNFIIGQGASTGAGVLPSFSSIDWGAAPYFIRIAIDENGGSNYTEIDTIQFWSVPYALYSGNAATLQQALALHDLSDADTTGAVNGYVLKWNGSLWVPAPDQDSDTALYSFNSGHALTADTALYALNSPMADTVIFAYYSDTADHALNSAYSTTSQNSMYCDTAVYAIATGSQYTYWNLTGNTGTSPSTHFLGTIDNNDLAVRTNNIERIRFTSSGRIAIGTTSPSASLHIAANDGFLHTGTFGNGTTLSPGAGTYMLWYPKKAAFRAGAATTTYWNDVNIGNYSMAGGNGTRASGAYSIAMGQYSEATGTNSVAMGYASIASGSSSIAMGSSCQAFGTYSVSLGRGNVANDTGAVCIGYHSNAMGKFSNAFGAYTYASGAYSTTMGYYASSNGKTGSFVYADASSTAPTYSTVNNQFVVRASGGTIFYSNSALTAGVSLPAGGGSWMSVSDRNKKENFKDESPDSILAKLCALDITSWNYKTQSPSIRHIGPMAQDFYKAFGLGESDTTITSIDIDGVNLIAIQALEQKTKELKEKAAEVDTLKAMVEKLEMEKKALETRIVNIEKLILVSPTLKASN